MRTDPKSYSYVLITAARNEEAYIEKTIQSVVMQTISPNNWVIVSDGSTDRTDEIVEQYTKRYGWMKLVRMSEHTRRNFASKAHCVNAAYEMVKDTDFDLVGNLDADISFENDYFEFLLGKFSEIRGLGVAGTRYTEDGCVPVYSYRDVAGQCQLFRRECFEEIGGYVPSRYGGVDNIAVLTARMKGWKTITFSEKGFIHHRPMSTAETNKWAAKIKHGREDYLLGNHPIWEALRIIYQLGRRPYVIGGLLVFYGYTNALLKRIEKPVPQDFVEFYRKEQMGRLRLILRNLLRGKVRIGET